jgi:putative endonuclease
MKLATPTSWTAGTGTLYTEVTINLHQRVWKHKNGTYEGFSSKYGFTRLLYYEEYAANT